jgi:prepilin-type N-terminal cleavage/methylation domain-containing protein
MNKKGFTLVELLATIVLLCLIILLATFSINKNVDDAKKRSHNTQVDTIISAGITYTNENDSIDLTDINGYRIYLKDLADNGYIDKKIIDPLNDKELNMNSSYIEITEVLTVQTASSGSIKNYKYNGNYLYTLYAVYK